MKFFEFASMNMLEEFNNLFAFQQFIIDKSGMILNVESI